MRINRITAWQLDLPLNRPYSLSAGRLKFERLDSTFIRIDTDEGVSGWGEACPWGHTYLPAHGHGVRAGIETLSPALLGLDPRGIDNVNHVMDSRLPGHQYVKSALDIACWDILGRSTGLPLWRLLGGGAPEPVPVNSSIPTGTSDQMIDEIFRAAEKGYKVHSAKVGGNDVDMNVNRINAILKALPEGHKVTFDANRSWLPATAIEILNLSNARCWVEQPCETLGECAHVASRTSNPIMLDECLHTYQDHIEAWNSGACEGVKVKPNRLGGLTMGRQIRDLGLALGWQMHIEDVGGSALADTAAIHLASSTPKFNRLASWLCHDHLAIDPIQDQGARNKSGYAIPPSSPGLGATPDMDALGHPVAIYGE
ncbi:MAG: mandelate racemase/muconate lactonizing enzyme family protein [Roseovarius sp.]|nr:mandelate racemase/muconate lactonizing enzyme family protein [Roseovarius sp.]